jgi:hypothetical protein
MNNTPTPDQNSHLAYGGPGPLREFVAECLCMAAFYAEMGVRYAEVDDDVLLEIATKKALAAFRQAVAVLRMLVEKNEQIAAAREKERADQHRKRQTAADTKESRQ